MSLYTANIARNGAAIVIPGLKVIPRENEGFLDFYFGQNDARTIPLLYNCGPYTATVFKDGVKVGSSIDLPNHFWRACWWFDLDPVTPASIKMQPDQLIANGYIPPFGDTGIPVVWPAGSGQIVFPGPMQLPFGVAGYEPTTGGRGGIGILRSDTAAWACGKTDARNILEVAKATATQPIWDYDNGKPIDLIAHPLSTTYSDANQGGPPNWRGPFPIDPANIRPVPNPLPPSNPSTPDTAHMEEICGVVAIAWGSPRYIRAVQMRVVKGFNEDNYSAGLFGAVTIFKRQMRGTAWLGRELFYCYWATKLAEDAGNLPADCLPSSTFKKIIDNQVTQFSKFIEPSPIFKALGIWDLNNAQVAFWQCDMVNQMLALYAGKWPAEWGPIYVKTFKNLAARVNADGLKQWPVAFPTWYWANACSDSAGIAPNWTPGSVPYKDFPTFWTAFSAAQIANTEPSGNNGQITAAQIAALNADPTNGGNYVNPSEYESWTYGALACAVYWDRGVGNGAMSAAYPNLEGAFSQQHAMMKTWVAKGGYLIPQCSISVTAKPYVPPPVGQNSPPDAPLAGQNSPPDTPPATGQDSPPATPPTGVNMTEITQGQLYRLTPKIRVPAGAINYGVKPGTWKNLSPDQAGLTTEGTDQATAIIKAFMDTTAEQITVTVEVFVDQAKTKTITLTETLSDVLIEGKSGGLDVTPVTGG